MATEKKGMMFVLSSPSGTGKTTLTKKLAENNINFDDFRFLIKTDMTLFVPKRLNLAEKGPSRFQSYN